MSLGIAATIGTALGFNKVCPAYVSQARGGLTPAWDSALQSEWTYSDFTNNTKRRYVWRLYNITVPEHPIAKRLVPKFQDGVPFINNGGQTVFLTLYPTAEIVVDRVSCPATFEVLPQTGQILFNEPTVRAFNSMSALNAGNSKVVAPTDIRALLAYQSNWRRATAVVA